MVPHPKQKNRPFPGLKKNSIVGSRKVVPHLKNVFFGHFPVVNNSRSKILRTSGPSQKIFKKSRSKILRTSGPSQQIFKISLSKILRTSGPSQQIFKKSLSKILRTSGPSQKNVKKTDSPRPQQIVKNLKNPQKSKKQQIYSFTKSRNLLGRDARPKRTV